MRGYHGGWEGSLKVVILYFLVIRLSLLVLSLFSNRVGSVLIILNISDLEVFQPEKIFIFGGIERFGKKLRIRLARTLRV